MIVLPNYDVVVPSGADMRVFATRNLGSDSRGEYRQTVSSTGTLSISLNFTPPSPEWVEVWVDGARLLNPRIKSTDGGTLFEIFNVQGNVINFSNYISGQITIICDSTPVVSQAATTIEIENRQGFRSSRSSLYVEPIILVPPQSGYARLSTDRQSMCYVPQTNFIGYDTFSYCLINNHGQYSKNYCVYIKVS